MRRVFLLLTLLLPLLRASAACHVITPTGAGTGDGHNWANACAGFTSLCAGSAMVHGDSYYLAGGGGVGTGYDHPSTSGLNLNVTSTGTNTNLTLSIKAARIADHCITDAGWNNSMAVDGGAGQAIFTTQGNTIFQFSTPNVILDGNFYPSGGDTSSLWASPGKGCGGTQCGIKLDFSGASNSFQNTHTMNPYYVSDGQTPRVDNTIIRATELAGCFSTCGLLGELWDGLHINGGIGTNIPQKTQAYHNYWHDSSQGFIASQGDIGTIIKYNYLFKNFSHSSAPAIHGNVWTPKGGSGQVFAYNVVQDVQGTAIIDVVNSGTPFTVDGIQIYGNIILMSNGNPFGLIGGYDDGAPIACTNSNICTNTKVYHNTLINESISTSNRLDGGTPVGAGSSIDEQDNLLWGSTPAVNQGCGAWTLGCTEDYDYFCNTTHAAQTHEQTDSSPGCTNTPIFMNWTLYTTAGFALARDTNAGSTLSSPFNTDMNGCTFTSSRGALQFGCSSGGNPQAGTPVCTPGTGTYSTTQSVTCTNPSSAPVECETQDGSTPATNGVSGCTNGILVSGTISVTPTLAGKVLKVVAGGTGFGDSNPAINTYTLPGGGTKTNSKRAIWLGPPGGK